MGPEFPPSTPERWRELAGKESKGADPDRLSWTTRDGLKLRPLYFEGLQPRPEAYPRLRIRQDFSSAELASMDVTALKLDIVGLQLDDQFSAQANLVSGSAAALSHALRAGARPEAVELIWPDRPDADFFGSLPATTRVWYSTVGLQLAGATPVQELGYGLAAWVELLRQLSPAQAARLDWVLPLGSELFTETAKLRAARRLWRQLRTAFGVPLEGQLQAVQSRLNFSQLDPETNLMRSTVAALAASLGGAASIRLEPFDRTELARRMARNQPRVVELEAYLGQVHDPLAGSRFLEDLTDQLARAAWKLMQECETGGGLSACPVGVALEQSRQLRVQRLSDNRDCLVGVNRYAVVGQTTPPTTDWRLSTPFEQLRGSTLGAVLLLVGAPARARVDFAHQTLALAGIQARETEQEQEALSGPEPIVVLCSPDQLHADTLPRLRAATAKRLGLAGKPTVADADFYLYAGCDRLAVLGELVRA